jgi:acyl-CoA reductase-like NAD-dependent aldehyde dehydrogenase
LAAGCTVVIKPSEMSAMQTRIVAEALHEAGLPKGVSISSTGAATWSARRCRAIRISPRFHSLAHPRWGSIW